MYHLLCLEVREMQACKYEWLREKIYSFGQETHGQALFQCNFCFTYKELQMSLDEFKLLENYNNLVQNLMEESTLVFSSSIQGQLSTSQLQLLCLLPHVNYKITNFFCLLASQLQLHQGLSQSSQNLSPSIFFLNWHIFLNRLDFMMENMIRVTDENKACSLYFLYFTLCLPSNFMRKYCRPDI